MDENITPNQSTNPPTDSIPPEPQTESVPTTSQNETPAPTMPSETQSSLPQEDLQVEAPLVEETPQDVISEQMPTNVVGSVEVPSEAPLEDVEVPTLKAMDEDEDKPAPLDPDSYSYQNLESNKVNAQAEQPYQAFMEQSAPTDKVHKGLSLKTIVIALSGVFVLGLIASFTTILLIAYGFIPVKSAALQGFANKVALAIPFLPRTPQQVLLAAFDAHQDVSTANVEASFAISGGGLEEMLMGIGSSFDIVVSGDIDIDVENPKAEVNVNIPNIVNADTIFITEGNLTTSAFRINSFGDTISTMAVALLGSFDLDVLTNQWVRYEFEEADSAARNIVDETQLSREDQFDESFEKFIDELDAAQVIDKLVLTNEEYEGNKVYDIKLELTKEDLKEIADILAEIAETQEDVQMDSYDASTFDYIDSLEGIDTFTIDMKVNKKSKYIELISLHWVLDPEASFDSIPGELDVLGVSNFDTSSKVDMVVAIRLKDVGKQVDISIPASAIDVEKWVDEIVMPEVEKGTGFLGGIDPSGQANSAREASAKSALNKYSLYINSAVISGGTLPTTQAEFEDLMFKETGDFANEYSVQYEYLLDPEGYMLYTGYPVGSNYVVLGNWNEQDSNGYPFKQELFSTTELELTLFLTEMGKTPRFQSVESTPQTKPEVDEESPFSQFLE